MEYKKRKIPINTEERERGERTSKKCYRAGAGSHTKPGAGGRGNTQDWKIQ